MLTFAEPERLRQELTTIGTIVEEAIDSMRRTLSMQEDQGRWHLEAEYPRLSLYVDHIKLRQAIRNLIANAIDAQPDGGHVRVVVEDGKEEFLIHIHDAGPGIPAKLASKITEPFFTTRAEGTGLGLALVHSIVRLHGGTIEVSASPSPLGGAHLLLRLPRVTELSPASAA